MDIDEIKDKFDLSKYQIKKYGALFETLDVTKDGFIDFVDFVLGAQAVKTRYGWSDREPLYLDLLTAKANFWVMIHAYLGTIPDNKINMNQFIQFYGEIKYAVEKGKTVRFGLKELSINKNASPAWLTSVMITTFKNIDFDASHMITKKEYRIYLKAIEVPVNRMNFGDIWRKITLNNPDRGIKIDFMEELLMQWLLNWDENDPKPGDLFPCGGYLVQWS